MKTEILSISQMAKLLNLPHSSFGFQAIKIYHEAKKAGYEYKDLGFVKTNAFIQSLK